MSEWSHFDAFPHLAGLERLRAQFHSHTFARHAHDYYVIGMIRRGVQSFEYGKRHFVTPNGALCIINPGEMHTGQAETAAGFRYLALYPSTDLMRTVAAETHGRDEALPWFDAAVVAEPKIVERVVRLHQVLDTSSDTLEQQTTLFDALVALVSHYTSPRPTLLLNASHQPAARRMRDYMQTAFGENVSLERLASIVNLSPWHAARVFRHEYNLPPHAYLEGIRIQHARDMVRQGLPLAEVALATGFVDQSHFTRRFKRHLGITPGQYAQDHKNVQDSTRTTFYTP